MTVSTLVTLPRTLLTARLAAAFDLASLALIAIRKC